jgi:hypothetical protein
MAAVILSMTVFGPVKNSGLVWLHLRQSQGTQIGHPKCRVHEAAQHI